MGFLRKLKKEQLADQNMLIFEKIFLKIFRPKNMIFFGTNINLNEIISKIFRPKKCGLLRRFLGVLKQKQMVFKD